MRNFVLIAVVSGFPLGFARSSAQTAQLPSRLVTQFPELAWVENVATRPNGDLLITELTPKPILYTVIDPASSSPTVQVVYDFSSNATQSLLGITETSHDNFVVLSAAGNIGPFFAWSINFKSKSGVQIKQIAELLGAKLPNGVTSLSSCSDVVLIADSFAGLVWRLNTITKEIDVAAQLPEMAPPTNGTGGSPVGINGVKVSKGHLYWTNSARATVFRIKIKPDGRVENNAKPEAVAKLPVSFVDDFVIADSGLLFVMASADNQVWMTSSLPGGRATPVVGAKNLSTVSGATAGLMGKTKDDKHVLYVVTSGAQADGNVTEGGKVVAVDTREVKISDLNAYMY